MNVRTPDKKWGLIGARIPETILERMKLDMNRMIFQAGEKLCPNPAEREETNNAIREIMITLYMRGILRGYVDRNLLLHAVVDGDHPEVANCE